MAKSWRTKKQIKKFNPKEWVFESQTRPKRYFDLKTKIGLHLGRAQKRMGEGEKKRKRKKRRREEKKKGRSKVWNYDYEYGF